jgi:hypothetical protein
VDNHQIDGTGGGGIGGGSHRSAVHSRASKERLRSVAQFDGNLAGHLLTSMATPTPQPST